MKYDRVPQSGMLAGIKAEADARGARRIVFDAIDVLLILLDDLLDDRIIIHHTDCGMELFTNETMPELLEKSLETVRLEEGKDATPVGAASDS
jgi:hypothetical protein